MEYPCFCGEIRKYYVDVPSYLALCSILIILHFVFLLIFFKIVYCNHFAMHAQTGLRNMLKRKQKTEEFCRRVLKF